jgi:uncharacterized protein YbjT (DUF2867 family)
MSHIILVTGAAGGQQGSTGRIIAMRLLKQGLSVRAFVHKRDARCDELLKHGAEVVEGDLLNPASVQAALKGVERAYFSYPVQDGLLEATTIFADSASEEGLEFVVNNSQYQDTPDLPTFRDLRDAGSFRNLQHRLADRIFDWAKVETIHIQAPPYYENVRALVRGSVAAQDTVFLPWGDGDAIIPLAGAEDVALVAATLLTGSSVPTVKVYPIVSEVLTAQQIVDTLSKAIGRPIRYVPITDEQWVEAVKQRINPHAVDHLSHLWQYFRNLKERRKATSTVLDVTDHAPQKLEDFFRSNAEAFAAAKN